MCTDPIKTVHCKESYWKNSSTKPLKMLRGLYPHLDTCNTCLNLVYVGTTATMLDIECEGSVWQKNNKRLDGFR